MKKERWAKGLWCFGVILIVSMVATGWFLSEKGFIGIIPNTATNDGIPDIVDETLLTAPPEEEFVVVDEKISYESLFDVFKRSSEKKNFISSPVSMSDDGDYGTVLLRGDVVYIKDRTLYLTWGFYYNIDGVLYYQLGDYLAITIPEGTKILFYDGKAPADVPDPEIKQFEDVKVGDIVFMTVEFSSGEGIKILWFALNPIGFF